MRRSLRLTPRRTGPNFATIVTTDDFDHASNLSRPGVFRLNLGLGRATFERLVGPIAEPDYTALDQSEPDYTALDRIIPHPVYAKQRWISILNPSERTFREVVLPLLAEAHDRLAAKRTRATSPRPGEGKGLAAGRSPDHRP